MAYRAPCGPCAAIFCGYSLPASRGWVSDSCLTGRVPPGLPHPSTPPARDKIPVRQELPPADLRIFSDKLRLSLKKPKMGRFTLRDTSGASTMSTTDTELEQLANREYKWGFVSDIEAESAPPGLNEDIIRFISAKKQEPQWMLDWRLKAYRHWLTMEEPHHW